MKLRDIKELHMKPKEELRTMLKELRESVNAARVEHAQHKLTNTSSLKNMKTDIARIHTVLKVKSMQEDGTIPTQEGSKA